MSSIISFWPLSVHRKLCCFETMTPLSFLANSTSLLQSTLPRILMPH
ncbi:MAG: hypothetical protein ACFE8T_14110 [Promethearchaeota archaeon]